MSGIRGSLRALLSNLIDYAGLYPPAALPLPTVAEKYERYLVSPQSWILNRVVLPVTKLKELRPGANWRITLLVDDEPGPLLSQVETLETKYATRLSLPTYCEVPLDRITRGFAKVRTGGLTPDAIPASDQLADFLYEAAARRIPFKATAGLHHPIRSEHPLTDATEGPRAILHGFVNVFVAAAFAWHHNDRALILDLLNESDPAGFEFLEDEARWRGRSLSSIQIQAARHDFAHSFGSCSFEEPIADLRRLELLP